MSPDTASAREWTFGGAEGRELFVRSLEGDRPRAAVVIVHGFGEHSGRYLETMDRFARNGYSSYVMDLRGHGRSGGVPSHIEGLSRVVEDIRILTALAAREAAATAGEPREVILLGHSMGGLLALHQLLFHQSDYAACIASAASLLPPENASKLLIAMAGVLARILPLLPVSPLEQGVSTRNQEMLDRDDADELFYRGGFRARTGYELLQAQMLLSRRMAEITLPVLALHGGGDQLINPRATEILFRLVGSTDKTKRIFPGLYHEIMNEPERDTVFDFIFSWLDSRTQGPPPHE